MTVSNILFLQTVFVISYNVFFFNYLDIYITRVDVAPYPIKQTSHLRGVV